MDEADMTHRVVVLLLLCFIEGENENYYKIMLRTDIRALKIYNGIILYISYTQCKTLDGHRLPLPRACREEKIKPN